MKKQLHAVTHSNFGQGYKDYFVVGIPGTAPSVAPFAVVTDIAGISAVFGAAAGAVAASAGMDVNPGVATAVSIASAVAAAGAGLVVSGFTRFATPRMYQAGALAAGLTVAAPFAALSHEAYRQAETLSAQQASTDEQHGLRVEGNTAEGYTVTVQPKKPAL